MIFLQAFLEVVLVLVIADHMEIYMLDLVHMAFYPQEADLSVHVLLLVLHGFQPVYP